MGFLLAVDLRAIPVLLTDFVLVQVSQTLCGFRLLRATYREPVQCEHLEARTSVPQRGVALALPLQHGSLETVNHLPLLGRLPRSRILQANLKTKQSKTKTNKAISTIQKYWYRILNCML